MGREEERRRSLLGILKIAIHSMTVRILNGNQLKRSLIVKMPVKDQSVEEQSVLY